MFTIIKIKKRKKFYKVKIKVKSLDRQLIFIRD